jgi:ribosomal protein S27AE
LLSLRRYCYPCGDIVILAEILLSLRRYCYPCGDIVILAESQLKSHLASFSLFFIQSCSQKKQRTDRRILIQCDTAELHVEFTFTLHWVILTSLKEHLLVFLGDCGVNLQTTLWTYVVEKSKTQIYMVVFILLVIPTKTRTGHLPHSSQKL